LPEEKAVTMVDAVRRALKELGDVSNEELAAHLHHAYGVVVTPNFVPVLRAMVKDKENLEARRRRAQEQAEPARQGPVRVSHVLE
jgi:hypothetical protein